MFRVLFVCTGNICRSPTAEGMFRRLVTEAGLDQRIAASSAGTIDYHVGGQADRRTRLAAKRRGIDLDEHVARQLEPADFDRFELLLAMDRVHLKALRLMATAGRMEQVDLFLNFAPELGLRDMPDPYYGGADGFERVLDLCQAGAAGLLDHICRSLKP
jgi:protein-tyrosine phosphatase